MKNRIFMTAAAATLLIAGAAQAQTAPRADGGPQRPGGPARALMMLGLADTNGDNAVTRAELEQFHGEMFDFRDSNEDGFLDREDASPARQRLAQMRAEGAAEAAAPHRSRAMRGARGARRMMEELDTDGDGRISRAEFVERRSPVFTRLDADENGTVTGAEIDAALEARQERRATRRQARMWWRD